jgi:hypothetical protein
MNKQEPAGLKQGKLKKVSSELNCVRLAGWDAWLVRKLRNPIPHP